jgi:sugar (pentulose or hexulose) kinase
MKTFLAVDLGASSGRVMAGRFDGRTLAIEEVHRFENAGVELPGGSFWDIVGLFRAVTEGLRLAVARYGEEVASIGIDSWGCDFALLSKDGRLLGLPHQYRDSRHLGMAAEMARRIPPPQAYASTGLVDNFYNSSVHLLAESLRASPMLAQAARLLFIPDLLAYWLTGKQAVERSVASTSQLFNPRSADWAWDVIDALELPRRIFGPVVASGSLLGPLAGAAASTIGRPVPVVSTASHDTAAAVAGIPLTAENNLWLSSGTWSIMGLEIPEPITTAEAAAAGFCNELGVGGTTRLLKNIAGLWLIQECRRHWNLTGEARSFSQLGELAQQAEPFAAFIDPDDAVFAAPGDMPEKIRAFCQRTGQRVPASQGEVLRVATESLALKYRFVYQNFCRVTGRNFSRLHVGGGGIQNAMLTQATADALGIEVVAGPVEATSCGNIITQMVATGAIADFAAGRSLLEESFDFSVYQPHDHPRWTEAYARFLSVAAPA